MKKDIIKSKPILVLFYVSWCGYCKQIMPIWAKIKKKLNKNKHIIVKELNGDIFTKVVKKCEIKGYPTILFFDKNKVIEYKGNRTVEAILQFLRKKNNNNI